MRFLECDNTGEISLTRYFVGDDTPQYAILSHTWGADTEEVSFKDMIDGTGKSKAGYEKIRFCGEQARRDGLHYFWVDTCCIDKSNNNELSEAINSMFRWYRNADRCYVYLWDVSGFALDADHESTQLPWESAFRKSKWFTRGWTLQELIAPALVEFFSRDGEKLGNRSSLERYIHEITGIPVKALRGSPLSDFSITERMLWTEKRSTTRKEDIAYSLLGIFEVVMPLIYGEGRESALKRLREEINKASKGARHEDFSVTFSLSDFADINNFVAREEELAEIHRTLSGDGSRRSVVLHGLGGIGKTQLTMAYAKRHRDNYSAILWLNIKDEDSLKQSFVQVAKQILRDQPLASPLSSVDMKGNVENVVDAVKAWLSLPYNTRWLMIYDNYDNPKLPSNSDPAAVDIHKFLPESYQGSVIITTRSSQVKIGHPIQIRKLKDIRDSLKILSNASRREGIINDPDAIRLAKELDGLPLALATAGAYLEQTATSFSDYFRLYKASWGKLQKTSPELGSYEGSLYSTWQLSFDHVKQRNELSANLLRLWAYFDNQDIWFELLRHSTSKSEKWIYELTKDEISFNDAVRVLINHGLVEVDTSSQKWPESRGYSIHGCVHSWITHILNQEWDYDLARLALTLVGLHIEELGDIDFYIIQRRLLPHAARCLYYVSNNMFIDRGMEWAFHSLGSLYTELGKPGDAEEMYDRALQGKEMALGTEHKSTIRTVHEIGRVYAEQGKLAKAGQMYNRVLQGRVLQGNEKALEAVDLLALRTLNNLGILYRTQGRLDESEQIYRQALQGYEKLLGAEHTKTLEVIHNVGDLSLAQGKLTDAEEMFQRVLQGFERTGPEHKSTLNTVAALGILYTKQGKLAQAEQMYQQALQGFEKMYRTQSLPALNIAHNFGELYVKQGKLAEAKQMYERALQGYEKAVGEDSTETYLPILNTTWGLGQLFEMQGDIGKARIMYSKALTGYEKIFERDHPGSRSLRSSLHNLDAAMENEALTGVNESMDNTQVGLSHLVAEETPSKSKRRKLF